MPLEASRRTEEMIREYEAIAERCEADATQIGWRGTGYSALMQVSGHFRAKARNLRTVNNARALSAGVMKLGGVDVRD